MTANGPVVQSAAFVAAGSGYRLRVVCEPREGPVRGTVVLAHAFAEEMNKSRRMCARMARELAADGWRVARRDFHGCGDSSGELRDASWSAWIEDLEAELSQADARLPVWLWCVRAGALLAPAVLGAHPHVHLLLWQPVSSGAQHLQQFLRLHAGARIVGSAKQAAALSPAHRLKAGEIVEVGGYELSPALTSGLEQASFDVPPGHTGRIVWLELCGDEAPQPSPATVRAVERLRARRLRVDVEALAGPQFWQTLEIEESEALLACSRRQLAAPSGGEAGGGAVATVGGLGMRHA